jgi:CRISPR-associated protein Cas2
VRLEQDEAVWSLILFDLPVQTKPQRTAATQFRNLLLDLAYTRVQLSVYARFSPSGHSLIPAVRKIKANLPEGGDVQILSVTDHQWATAYRFSSQPADPPLHQPTPLTIF